MSTPDEAARMKVAMICPYSLSIPGGVQGQVLGLARALRELGHETRVLAPCDGPPPTPFVMSVGTEHQGGEQRVDLADRARARRPRSARSRPCASFEPDVMHLHEPLVPGPTTSALLGTKIPSVGTFHMAAERRDTFYRYLRKPATGVAKRLTIRTAVSEDARRTAQESLGGSYWVLPNGVDVVPFAKADPWPSSAPAVLFVGRHEPRKGLGVLLDAWQRDRPRRGALGRERRTGDRAPCGRGTSRRVEWLGRITDDEKARRMRGAEIFCAPAISGESFGVVLLEAMAADDRSGGVRHPRLPQRRPPRRRGAHDRTRRRASRCGTRSAGCSTTRIAGPSSPTQGSAGPPSSRWYGSRSVSSLCTNRRSPAHRSSSGRRRPIRGPDAVD